MDEAHIKEIAGSGLNITIRDMLREIQRSKTPFRYERDERWGQLEQALQDSVHEQFGMGISAGIDWEHYTILDPSIADKQLSKETLIPYLRCNFYCAEYLAAKRR
jgi:hypothetical protein